MSHPLFFVDREGSYSDVDLEEEVVVSEEGAKEQLEKEKINKDEIDKEHTIQERIDQGHIRQKKFDKRGSGQEKPYKKQIHHGDVCIVPEPKQKDSTEGPGKSRVPENVVWVDEDDAHHAVNISNLKRRRKLRRRMGETHVSGTEYSKRLREMYASKPTEGAKGPGVKGPGAWAQLPSAQQTNKGGGDQHSDDGIDVSDDSDGDSDREGQGHGDVQELLQSTAKFMALRKRKTKEKGLLHEPKPLKSGVLSIRSVRNANGEAPNNAEARCVEFHPSGRLLMTAGYDKTLRIFQVDAERNAKVQSIHMEGFPIHTAKFTGGGTQVVLAGRRRYFHQVDLNSGVVSRVTTLSNHQERAWDKFEVSADGSRLAFLGQEGKIVIVANDTKREIGQLRLNGRVAAVAFAAARDNENHVYASSLDGTVYLWDTRRMACIDRHKDEGAIHTTSIATSPTHYAVGSDSGVVNVYKLSAMRAPTKASFGIRTEKPDKSFLNLTTPIDQLAFNHDGRLLAFSSHDKKNAIRIAHTPSMTVYSNWPSMRTNVRRACCLNFSPKGRYFAIGNDKGDVQLLRLGAYSFA